MKANQDSRAASTETRNTAPRRAQVNTALVSKRAGESARQGVRNGGDEGRARGMDVTRTRRDGVERRTKKDKYESEAHSRRRTNNVC